MELKTAYTVYRLYDAEDNLLYVGCTKHPAHRLDRHSRSGWWSEVARIDETHFDNSNDAANFEEQCFVSKAPRYNGKRHVRYRTKRRERVTPPPQKTTLSGVELERMRTPQEVAEYLKVDVRTVYRWLREGKMNAIRFQREYRIAESDLRDFIQQHRTGREER